MAVRVDADIRAAMERLQDRDGVLMSEQIRRALRSWLEKRGVLKKEAKRKRAVTRRRS